jgi:hypothetical protein
VDLRVLEDDLSRLLKRRVRALSQLRRPRITSRPPSAGLRRKKSSA